MSTPTDFNARQRQHMGRTLAKYGDQIAGIMRMLEADCGIMDADREAFTSEDGQHYADAVRWLRQSATQCFMMADLIGGIDTRDGILGASEPHVERSREPPPWP